MNEEMFDDLLKLIELLIDEKIEDAFGRDSLWEACQKTDALTEFKRKYATEK